MRKRDRLKKFVPGRWGKNARFQETQLQAQRSTALEFLEAHALAATLPPPAASKRRASPERRARRKRVQASRRRNRGR